MTRRPMTAWPRRKSRRHCRCHPDRSRACRTRHLQGHHRALAPRARRSCSPTVLVLYGRSFPAPTWTSPVAPRAGRPGRREYQRGPALPSLFAVEPGQSGPGRRKALVMPAPSAAKVGASSRRPSRKKPKRICSAKRRPLPGGTHRTVLWVSKPWSMPLPSGKSPI